MSTNLQNSDCKETNENQQKPSHESQPSHIPILSSCCQGSNSSLDSPEEPVLKPSIMSIPRNSNTSLSSIVPCCLKSSNSTYTLALEKEYETLQAAFFALTSHFAKVQFRLRQIIQARPSERDRLLAELTEVAFCGTDEFEFTNMPEMQKDLEYMGNVRRRQGYLIDRLRSQLEVIAQQGDEDCCQQGHPKKTVKIDENAKK